MGPARAAGVVCSLILVLLHITAAGAQQLPVDVSSRVGRAATFVYNYTPAQYATRLVDRDVYWSNQPTSGQGGYGKLYFPPNVLSGAYVPVNRVPVEAVVYGRLRLLTACNKPAGGCDLAWFQANHPDWIIYKADQQTPAYQYNNKLWTPIDISNSEAQKWLIENYYAPLLALGYQALSVDNVSPQNDFGEAGTCSIVPVTNCTADGGVWRRLYSGNRYRDAAFLEARVEWAKKVTAWAHSVGKKTMANIVYADDDLRGTTELVSAYDLWFDEQGFTANGRPSICDLNYYSSGAFWMRKVQFIAGMNGGAGPEGYVVQNSICPALALSQPGRRSNFDMVEYATASYLLVKNSQSYMTMFFDTGTRCGMAAFCDDELGARWPQFWLEHGLPLGKLRRNVHVFYREFASALALVNPIDIPQQHDLGEAVRFREDCTRWTGLVQIQPKTGMVLRPIPWNGCPR